MAEVWTMKGRLGLVPVAFTSEQVDSLNHELSKLTFFCIWLSLTLRFLHFSLLPLLQFFVKSRSSNTQLPVFMEVLSYPSHLSTLFYCYILIFDHSTAFLCGISIFSFSSLDFLLRLISCTVISSQSITFSEWQKCQLQAPSRRKACELGPLSLQSTMSFSMKSKAIQTHPPIPAGILNNLSRAIRRMPS